MKNYTKESFLKEKERLMQIGLMGGTLSPTKNFCKYFLREVEEFDTDINNYETDEYESWRVVLNLDSIAEAEDFIEDINLWGHIQDYNL